MRGAFAGNIFDLGAATSAALYADGGGSFHATRDVLKPRPWCVDDFDALADRWIPASSDPDVAGSIPSPWRKCVVFVDNSGADVLLGMIPLAANSRGADAR